jgi:serine/threonine-protein kinase
MDLTHAQLSIAGPVRSNNEDFVTFWQPDDVDERRQQGAIAVLADGVGGHGFGEVASRLAGEVAVQEFRRARPDLPATQMLWQLFNAVNSAVYDAGANGNSGQGRMATTLTVAVFRNNAITIGHVGDCRAYIVQGGRIRRLTTDHSYVTMQLKMGLISEREAMLSEMRSVLTRSIGKDITVQVDYYNVVVNRDDCLVQCCDGVHCAVAEGEIAEIVSRLPPDEACKELVALAERRGADDNLSVQVFRVERVEQLLYYRGVPLYQEVPNSAMSNEVEVGQVVDDRFQITGLISRSGMASIFQATDLTNNQVVALKVPFMQFESDPGFYSRFQREEEIGKLLNHPYILRIIPLEQKSRPYIAMEYLEGHTLRQLMRSVRPVPMADALHIASRVCEALDHMHKHNIVHRDLKPENIMLCNDGSLRIMDFGIAKAAGMRRLTFTGLTSAMGTPDYMAPEQVKGSRGDERTDIYALGVMLYEMVAGTPPFEGGSPYAIMNARLTGDPPAPRRWNPEISPQVEEIILHALESDSDKRYANALAMKAELDAPEKVTVTGRHERLRPPVPPAQARGYPMGMLVVAMLVPVILCGLFLLYFVFWMAPR